MVDHEVFGVDYGLISENDFGGPWSFDLVRKRGMRLLLTIAAIRQPLNLFQIM